MLKYVLVALINLPVVVLSLIWSVRMYREGQLQRFTVILWGAFWAAALAGLLLLYPVENYLISHRLIDGPRFGVFNLLEITAIIWLMHLAYRLYHKADRIEQRLAKLNRETSLRISELQATLAASSQPDTKHQERNTK